MTARPRRIRLRMIIAFALGVQVRYTVALDDLGAVEQQSGFSVVPERADAGREQGRHQIDPHFVDQPSLECLSGEVAGCWRHVSLTGQGLWARALGTPSVTNVNGACG
jgi:hypothetical protein